ncbi:cytochrome P450 [Artemisia annua]|uniref:Cytochrome P450 n=1 Tax=Artemisia annua TaxID=35608 RepID=A0A2U1MFQ7_ARTAN|nr:cytochrome P450 [Artemisia annua]
MAFHEYATILSVFFIFMSLLTFTYRHQKERSIIPTNWPIVGMIPSFIVNVNRLHDYITEFLIHTGGTFMWKGPWFSKMNMLMSAHPLDIQHVLCKNFNNYPKGDKFREMFDIFGNGIFNSDGELWEINRKVTMSVFKRSEYHYLFETIIWHKVEKGLLPLLESTFVQGMEIDLQEIFERFAFDITCKLFLDHDPKSLSLDFPYIPCQKALLDVEEVIVYRHFTPVNIWKLKRFLRWGDEKKLINAWKSIDDFIYKCLARNHEYNNMKGEHREKQFVFLTTFMREIREERCDFADPTKLLRDTLLSLMIAGKDNISSALSWFFYMLAKNQNVEDKILKEIHAHLEVKIGVRWNEKELGQMVYLHGAINETLRLFPPVALNHKSPLQQDILPSGHKVNQNTKIILAFYTMGRMKSIWGEDCMEFRPERWFAKGGGIKHEPSYIFPAFNAGPRTCLGKDMSFYQLKVVIATIVYHYHVELVKGHSVLPAHAIVLHMKHGLKVRLTKRREANRI